ncbi:MAG: ubiquitin-like protein Pup [Actinomycetaceae bacterium]|nr:ubiquitin-like protein Pup [Actinomycetaceae bacterium]
MQQQVFGGGPDHDEDDAPAAKQQQVSALDDILDEIDSVLETDAQIFVQDFVQKGGQ